MNKYLLLVLISTLAFAYTPDEAIVTHYDLDGNLISEEAL